MKFKDMVNGCIDYIGRHRMLLLLLSGLSFMSILDIPGSPAFKMPNSIQVLYLTFVSIFKGLLLLMLMAPLFKTRLGRIVIWILTVLFASLAATNAISFHYYGIGITRKLILIFAQTNKAEAMGFMPGLMQNLLYLSKSTWLYVCVLLSVGLIYLVRLMTGKLFGAIITVCGAVGLFAFTVFCMTYTSGRTAHLLSVRLIKYGKEVKDANKEYEELRRHKRPLPYKNTAKSEHKASQVIVVLGESAHRRHHSLYGYRLSTTPCLELLADSLVVFTDVIGSSKSTAGNMERILSLKEDDTTCDDGLKFPLVVDLFKEMDYKIFWLSNQERSGTVSNTSGVMAMNADVINYVGAENSEDALVVRYDEALLLPMIQALNDTSAYKLIFLHLLGSHVEYKTRYPVNFDVFSAKDEIAAFQYPWLDEAMAQRRAEYDNSIRYTDSLLGEIIRKASQLDEPTIVVYFSDHGEEVYDYGAYSGRNDNTVQVPFIFYANEAYSSANREILERIKAVKDKPLSTANLVHFLISLTGGTYELYDPRLDILSDEYVTRPRYVDEEIWSHDLK
ncbi:MAG: phosphoethanolamine transferase [Bacteroidales bacterium]|nr:phosphoethanolamine transferase [Bacteroidales bacterium]